MGCWWRLIRVLYMVAFNSNFVSAVIRVHAPKLKAISTTKMVGSASAMAESFALTSGTIRLELFVSNYSLMSKNTFILLYTSK